MSQAEIIPTARVHSFPPLAYKNVPVLTTEMLAQAYEVEAKQIRQNFANNKERFIEGKHFFSVSGQELKTFLLCVENFDSQISPKVRVLTLWTDRGCARHAKSLNTDTAWDMYELLEETFFAAAQREPAPETPEVPLSASHRSELKAIVDAKLSTYPASVQGKARSEIWTRFNRNFKIAEYAQLPAKRMAEARDYLIELDVKALKKLPPADAYALPAAEPVPAPALPATDDIDGHFAAIREHIRQINNHEDAIFQAVRKGMPPLRGTSSFAPLINRNMENAGWSLHYALKSLEASARIAVAAGQI